MSEALANSIVRIDEVPCRWRQQNVLMHRYNTTRLHGVTP